MSDQTVEVPLRDAKDAPYDFSVWQKSIHWIMAFLIIAMLIAGHGFNDPGKEFAERLWSRSQHGSAGLVVGIFLIIRILMRLWRGVPAESKTTLKLQRILSQFSHWGMYTVMAALVLSGIAVGLFTTSPMELPILGGFDISRSGNTSEEIYLQVRWYHELATDIAIGFVALHAAAAFFHLFWVRDRIMQRMARFWRQNEGAV